MDGHIQPLHESPRRPSRIHTTPEHYRNQERESRHSRVPKTVHELQPLGPVVQPCSLSEGVHEAMYTRDQEIEAERPECEECEETERLADSTASLGDCVGSQIQVLEGNIYDVPREIGIGCDDGSEGVYAQDETDAGQHEWRDEVRSNEGVFRIEAGLWVNAPGCVRKELHCVVGE